MPMFALDPKQFKKVMVVDDELDDLEELDEFGNQINAKMPEESIDDLATSEESGLEEVPQRSNDDEEEDVVQVSSDDSEGSESDEDEVDDDDIQSSDASDSDEGLEEEYEADEAQSEAEDSSSG